MNNKYTVSQLSKELGVSVNTVWKRINKMGLRTVKEPVNNRDITFVLLSDAEHSELFETDSSSQGINNGGYEQNYEDSLRNDDVYEGQRVNSQAPDTVSVIETVMNYSKEMNNQMKEYVDRVITAESQVKLLETLDGRKEQEYIEVSAKVKQLEQRVNDLEVENKTLETLKNDNLMKINTLENLNLELKRQIVDLEASSKKGFWGF